MHCASGLKPVQFHLSSVGKRPCCSIPTFWLIFVAAEHLEVIHMVKIVDLLPTGEENAVPAKELARLVGLASVRELQRAISSERAHGEVILAKCTAGGGYFRPASDYETRKFIATVEARSANTRLAVSSAKAALEKSQKETAPGDCSAQDGRSAD